MYPSFADSCCPLPFKERPFVCSTDNLFQLSLGSFACFLHAGVHTYIEDLSYTSKSDDASEVERCVTNGNKRRTPCTVQPDLSYHFEEVLCSHSHGHHQQSVGHHWKLASEASGHFLCSSLTESGSVPASGTEVSSKDPYTQLSMHTPSTPRPVCRGGGGSLGLYEPPSRICGTKNSETNHFVVVHVLIEGQKHRFFL